MNELPESLFANPVWHALQTRHRRFALSASDACCYPAEVAPFAAVAAPSADALEQLRSLLTLGESVWLFGEDYPPVPGLSCTETLDCFQMVLSGEVPPPSSASTEIVRLSDADAMEMVALTTLAFPGYFRLRTCEMGAYYGVRSGSELVAMGGERLALDGYTEISGVCTHPAHRGRGLAASLIGRLARDHRRDGLVSWLHVGCTNQRAIDLYRRLGFTVARTVTANHIMREAPG